MTRQEKITEIGKLKPSTFTWDKKDIAKNQMSYFIIPFAHEIYSKRAPAKIVKSLESLNWKMINNVAKKDNKLVMLSVEQERQRVVDEKLFEKKRKQGLLSENEKLEFQTTRILSLTDPRNMNSIKLYLYDEMMPRCTSMEEHFEGQKNLIFQKSDIEKEWNFKYYEGPKDNLELKYTVNFLLDGLDLLIVDKHIAFFTIKTQLPLNDESTINDISSKFNRNMRDFRSMYVDVTTKTFSNDPSQGVNVFDWFSSLVEFEDKSLLSRTENKLQDIQNKKEYYPLFNASYNAKMITAMHVDEMSVAGEEIESAFTGDMLTMNIDGTSPLEETPYLLATSSELYPTKGWEGNEEYINEQIGNGQINIWKYWSGVALHDSLAFFSIGEGSSAIVNTSRNSYYFIYMLNLYATYKMRYFEHKLIDNDFVSIENIRPLFSDLQRLKNQYMCTELSSLFQPNAVHEAIKGSMKTDDMYDEIKDNIEATLEITSRNTDIVVTAFISVFTIAGMYFNQDWITDLFEKHLYLAITGGVIIFIGGAIGLHYRSFIIRMIGKFRTKIGIVSKFAE